MYNQNICGWNNEENEALIFLKECINLIGYCRAGWSL